MKESFDKAINWWADKISKRAAHSNGDSSTSSVMACIFADMGYKQPTEEQLKIFREELRNQLEQEYTECNGTWDIFLGCDYGPGLILSKAAKKAGINELNFPFKTNMRIRPGGEVLVSDGYAQPYIKI